LNKYHLPQIETNVRLTHTFRFVASSAFNGQIYQSGIIGAMGTIGRIINASVANIFATAKIHRVKCMAPISSQGTAATVSINWFGTNNNTPNKEVSDTSVSTAEPAYISTSPPRKSIGEDWFEFSAGSSSYIFTLVCPTGTVIDLTVSGIMADGPTDTATQSNIGTATVGVIYYLALDYPTSHILVPVSLTTTF